MPESRDLKPSNVFLDSENCPKITGFDISKFISDKSSIKSKKIKGTPIYLAPEVNLIKEYSKSSDIYAFSLIMYEILTENKPFKNINSPKEIQNKVAKKGERPSFVEPISEIYRNLIERCWSQEASLRPTFDEIVYELKNNPDFITDEIDKEKYYSYIKYLDESEITFDPSKRIKQFDCIIKSRQFTINENNSKTNYRNIYETELNNVLFNYDFININNFEKQKLIDISGFCKNYIIIDKASQKKYFAQRFKIKLDEIESYIIKYKKEFCNKINNSISLNHRSFMKFIGYSPIDFKNLSNSIIITEYGCNKSLKEVLDIDIKNKSKALLNDTQRLIILYGIASGMSYLHSKNIIHCNFDSSNIILDEFLFPKIIGHSHFNNFLQYEIKDKFDDVYSFGIIAYELISNEYFSREDPIILKFNESIPDCYRNLIEKCLLQDKTKRPTFDEIVYHF